MRFIFFGLLTTFIAPTVAAQVKEGSTVIVIRTSAEIALAADSRLSITTMEAGPDGKIVAKSGTPEQICKILTFNNVAASATGIDSNRTSGYDAQKYVKRSLRTPGTVSDKVKAFERMIQQPLTEELELIKRYSPERYKTKYLNTEASLAVVLCGVEKGVLVCHRRGFVARGIEKVSIEIHPDTCDAKNDGANCLLLLGHTDTILKKQAQNELPWGRTLWEAAEALVECEIESGDEKVGPPIDVLVITKNGVEWKRRKPMCEQTRKRSK